MMYAGVERELAGLQLDLKLTSGPKKSALELLRRKIEMQNENVVMARGKFQAARKVIHVERIMRDTLPTSPVWITALPQP